MSPQIEAVYTDGVLKPARELTLRDNQRVRLTIRGGLYMAVRPPCRSVVAD